MNNLNYNFKNPKLLELALTQSGADAENNNERLEFLGDRVLGLSIAMLLYEMFPNEHEGALAQRHAVLVSSGTLSEVASELGLVGKIRHGHMTAGRLKHVMADAVESILGAIFLDGGFDAARETVFKIWTPLAKKDLTPPKDAKTALQELVQQSGIGMLPEYEFLEHSGPSHSPVFNVRVSALGKQAIGNGTSKKTATAAAAAELLRILKDN
ncbi:MAG: ribonuclease III [Alphaproteobacteria bacterium]|nr:ribonuclease III [Alphaproteobacteria bacterium]